MYIFLGYPRLYRGGGMRGGGVVCLVAPVLCLWPGGRPLAVVREAAARAWWQSAAMVGHLVLGCEAVAMPVNAAHVCYTCEYIPFFPSLPLNIILILF